MIVLVQVTLDCKLINLVLVIFRSYRTLLSVSYTWQQLVLGLQLRFKMEVGALPALLIVRSGTSFLPFSFHLVWYLPSSLMAQRLKRLPAMLENWVRSLGSVPGSGRSPGEGNGNPLQYSCLENSMDRGAWRATVYGVSKSWTRLSDFTSLHFTSLHSTLLHSASASLPSHSIPPVSLNLNHLRKVFCVAVLPSLTPIYENITLLYFLHSIYHSLKFLYYIFSLMTFSTRM